MIIRRVTATAALLALAVGPSTTALAQFASPGTEKIALPAHDVALDAQRRNVGSVDAGLPPTALIPSPFAPPANADKGLPQGVSFIETKMGRVLTNAQGKTLYQLTPGLTIRRAVRNPAMFCVGACAELWQALPAPDDAQPIGAFKVIKGVNGSQWAYGNNPVFTYKLDKARGDLKGHEFEDGWFAISYVPPRPADQPSPASVQVALIEGDYRLTDWQGNLLYNLGRGRPPDPRPSPLLAGATSRPVGEWTIVHAEDRRQWAFRGKPVYMLAGKNPDDLPPGAALLTP